MINVIAMAELLKGEYRIAFEKIDMYATVNGVESYEESILNIYDMLMEAQQREDDVCKVIGSDVEEFCKAYFKKEKSEYDWFEKLKKLKGTLICLTIFSTIDILLEIEYTNSIFAIKSNVFPFILGFIVALLSTIIEKFVLTPIIFKKKKISSAGMSFGILAIFIAGMIVGVDFFGHIEIMAYTWMILAIVVILLIIYMVAYRILAKKGVKLYGESEAEKKAKKDVEKEIEQKATMKMIAPIMEKRYQRIRKRKAKRGIEYTMKNFQTLIHKEGAFGKIFDIFILFIIVIVVATSVLNSILDKEYVLGVLLAVILGVVEYGVYRIFLKTVSDTSKCQIYLVDECIRRGISLSEYNVENM